MCVRVYTYKEEGERDIFQSGKVCCHFTNKIIRFTDTLKVVPSDINLGILFGVVEKFFILVCLTEKTSITLDWSLVIVFSLVFLEIRLVYL